MRDERPSPETLYLDWSLWPDHWLQVGPDGLANHQYHGADDDSLEEALDVGPSPAGLVILRLHLSGLYYFIKSYLTRLFMNWFTWFPLQQTLLTTNIVLVFWTCIFNFDITFLSLFYLVHLVPHVSVDY